MTDEEREEFLEGVNKKDIWEMAEDKAKQGVEADVTETKISACINAVSALTGTGIASLEKALEQKIELLLQAGGFRLSHSKSGR